MTMKCNMINNTQIPEAVCRILDTIKEAGFEAYIVGGCVRDALLGRTPKDWDITTSALPHQVKALFAHTVDTGIKHGTVMVILHGEGYEVTTYRVDGEYKDSRHPEHVTFTRSLEEDLKRRDFTINAFAWNENGVVDLFNGMSDLENGIIRCVGDPTQRFSEDALRIMRAVRFSAQLGFEIESETERQIRAFAENLSNISMERIRVEWEKTLISPNPDFVNKYRILGLAPFIIKDYYGKCFDPERNGLLKKIMKRKAGSEDDVYRILAMSVFFLNLSPDETDRAFRNLKYDNKTRERVVSVIRNLNEPVTADRLQIKRSLNKMGPDTYNILLLLRSITAELNDNADEKQNLNNVRLILRDIIDRNEPWSIAQLEINGKDLINAGAASGKKIGEFLEKILQKVIQSPTLNTKAQLCDPVFLSEVENECKG